MSEPNPYQHIPSHSFPQLISQSTLDAALQAQQRLNSLSSLLHDSVYHLAISTDISNLVKDAASHISNISASLIPNDTQIGIINSIKDMVNSIPTSMVDVINLINSSLDSIKSIDFTSLSNQHKQINYEQYKPVIDALSSIQHTNNNDASLTHSPIYNSSETTTDDTLTTIKEHKPVNVIALIGLIFAIYNTILGTYTNLFKPNTSR